MKTTREQIIELQQYFKEMIASFYGHDKDTLINIELTINEVIQLESLLQSQDNQGCQDSGQVGGQVGGQDNQSYAAYAADAAYAAAYAAYAAADAADAAARLNTPKKCADIVRKHYPNPPKL